MTPLIGIPDDTDFGSSSCMIFSVCSRKPPPACLPETGPPRVHPHSLPLLVIKHILIAEDDLFLVKMYKLELEAAGFEVTTVANGKLAIEAIERKRPDLLLLDLLMPEVDGFAVLSHVQRKDSHSFPIVVLSSSDQEIDKTKCKTFGARDFIVKGDIKMNQLAEIIKRYI